MKIDHFISWFAPEFGGPVVSLRNYVIAQAQRNHQVRVYTLDGYRGASSVMSLPSFIKMSVHSVDWPSRLGGSRVLRRTVEESEPADVYHLHGIWHRAQYYAYRKARREKRPYLIEVNGALDPLELANKPWRKRLVRSWFQDEMLHNASCIHVNSLREAKHLRELGFQTPIVVIPAGFNQSEFLALQERSKEIIPAWAEGLAGRNIILYLARIHPAKGIKDLLLAWSTLAIQNPGWTLVVVGPGDQHEVDSGKAFCRKAGIQEQTVWAGLVSDIERAWAYCRADFYVLPSHKENFGNTVQEALGYGTPVLTTRSTPWLELEQWQSGWLCDDNAISLVQALKKILELSPETRRRMGEAGRKVVSERFGLDYVADQQIATYEWLHGGPAPACLWKG
jgi:glycosyltransferase involved in cell wall biosynthesis